jgi:HlyD family secretion protein
VKVFLALVVAAVCAGLFYRFGDVVGATPVQAPADEALFLVERGDLEILVTEDGYLKAKNSIELKPLFRGEGLITWVIEEGSSVEEGDTLVEFEKKEQQNRIDELVNGIVQLESTHEAAVATLEIERRDAEASIEKAELNLKVAEMDLERYRDGEAPTKRRGMVLDTEKAEATLKRSRERLAGVPALAQEGFLTPAQVEEEHIKTREHEIALERAVKELELFDDYTVKMELLKKEAAERDARRQMRNAVEKTAITAKEKEANVTRLGGQLETQRARLEKQEEDLENMTMRAPQSGVVHYGDPGNSWSRDRVKIGSRVYRGSTVITLPDLSELEALIKVHEADIDRVQLEQAVRLTLDTYPGKVFSGAVSQIASVASSSGWDSSTKAFRVTVDLHPTDVTPRAGISAKLEIEVQHLEDVLFVPLHATFVENGEFFCFVWANAAVERRVVEVGVNNDHYVQMLSGLDEGDRVLLYDPRDSQAPSSVGAPESGAGEDESSGLSAIDSLGGVAQ